MVKTPAAVAAQAEQRLTEWSCLAGEAKTFTNEAFAALAQRRDDLKNALAVVARDLPHVTSAEISAEAVREVVASFGGRIAGLTPTIPEPKSASRAGRLGWLPGAATYSVIIDRFRCVPALRQ